MLFSFIYLCCIRLPHSQVNLEQNKINWISHRFLIPYLRPGPGLSPPQLSGHCLREMDLHNNGNNSNLLPNAGYVLFALLLFPSLILSVFVFPLLCSFSLLFFLSVFLSSCLCFCLLCLYLLPLCLLLLSLFFLSFLFSLLLSSFFLFFSLFSLPFSSLLFLS